jgi:hypothetical protein
MAVQDNMETSALYSLGDLTKEDDQMIIILHAVQFCSAHMAISRSVVGVSIIFYYFLSRCCLLLCMLVTDLTFLFLSFLFCPAHLGLGYG